MRMGKEKRAAILYARVKESNKSRLQKMAKRYLMSESQVLDIVLENADVEALIQKNLPKE